MCVSVVKCVYVSISFSNVDEKIPIAVKIFLNPKKYFVHPGREIIQFQAIFRGVCKCVYVSISFTTVDEKIPITVKIFLVA